MSNTAEPALMTPVPAGPGDVAELLVLQRCCWVQEAISNETLAIPPLHETHADIAGWIRTWRVWLVRVEGRLVGAVRAIPVGTTWEIGRLMVAPDLAGRGLGRTLLRHAESQAPDHITTFMLYTGSKSVRNQRIYRAAGYEVVDGKLVGSPVSDVEGVITLVKPR